MNWETIAQSKETIRVCLVGASHDIHDQFLHLWD
jgi:hypothetical protein